MHGVKLLPMSGSLIRTVDVMSRRRLQVTVALFVIANAALFVAAIAGPPPYHTEVINFDRDSVVRDARKFLLHLGTFNFLNDFVAIDVVFLRDQPQETPSFQLSTSLVVKGHHGRRVEMISAQRLAPLEVFFPARSTFSEKVRLWSRAIVDFSSLDLEVVFKYPDSNGPSVIFVVTYIDTAYALLEIVVRVVFLFIGIVALVYLWAVNTKKTSAPVQITTLKILLGLVVVAADPFIIFSYFTESFLLPFLDAVFALVLILATVAGTVIILETNRRYKTDILTKGAPFIVTFLLYFARMVFSSVGFGGPGLTKMLDLIRAFLAAVCFIRVVIAYISFEPEEKLEKWSVGAMIAVTFCLSLVFEVWGFVEPFIASTHEVQIFTYASVSTFVLFMARLYWPVDSSLYAEDSTGGGDISM
jgi:hypothetical protein